MADFRIWVGVWADYNAGRLHGAWIDCDGKDADELQEEVNALLRSSRYPNVTVMHEGQEVLSAEEFGIFDSEGFPADCVGESTPLDKVAAIVEALESLEDHDAVGFRFLMWNEHDADPVEAAEKAPDVMWRAGSRRDAIEEYYEETYDLDSIPEPFRYHIDWDGLAYDAQQSGWLTSFDDQEEGHVQIFHAND